MKSSIKISDFAMNDLFKKLDLSNNRAKAQIIRRIKDYSNRKLLYSIKSDYVKYLLNSNIIKNINNDQIKTYTLPLIASFVVTDGHFTIRKKKNLEVFEVGFSNLNLELVNAFNDLIYLTYNEVPSSVDYNSRLKRTRFVASWHKSMIKEIKNYLNDKKSIKNILESDDKILFECLRIALSCDGFISFYIAKEKYGYKGFDYYLRIRPELVLGCKPINLRNDWSKLTQKLNLPFILKDDRIKCNSWDDLEDFYKLGGFIPKTFIGKDSKYFEGRDKNNVLRLLLNIKENKLNNLISTSKENSNLKKMLISKLI